MSTLTVAQMVRRTAVAALFGALLASCGGDVDVCTNPGGECPRAFSIDIAVSSEGTFGALQLDITHTARVNFLGDDDKVDCIALVDAIVASNYLGEEVVKVGLISLYGVRTPSVIMRCGFRTFVEEPLPSDFHIEVTDASSTESKPIEPLPTVSISSVTERER
jgi:hypothetical protein